MYEHKILTKNIVLWSVTGDGIRYFYKPREILGLCSATAVIFFLLGRPGKSRPRSPAQQTSAIATELTNPSRSAFATLSHFLGVQSHLSAVDAVLNNC